MLYSQHTDFCILTLYSLHLQLIFPVPCSENSIWLGWHVSSCLFTSNLAEVCDWGASGVRYNGFISARGVTLRETKRSHINTASTSTICLCLSLHAICVLIMFLHLFAFLPPNTSQDKAEHHAVSHVPSLFLFWLHCLPPNPMTKCSHRALPSYTQACKLISCYIKREIKGEKCIF